MTKRIAILGGGMAGLTAAYYLTRTPELARENEVTVYSMGWRLGGKCASARDAQGRNVEHGLHVWFGCYANTFAMMKEVYDRRPAGGDYRFKDIGDLAKPQDFTPIGVQVAGGWEYFPINWPSNKGDPWDANLMPTFWELIETLAGWLKEAFEREIAGAPMPLTGTPPEHRPHFAASVDRAFEPDSAEHAAAMAALARSPSIESPSHGLQLLEHWAAAIARTEISHMQEAGAHFVALLEWLRGAIDDAAHLTGRDTLSARMLHEALVIASAVIKGSFWDLILRDAAFDSLDSQDFRAWLKRHGADARIVDTSSFIRIVYDTLYQFHDGDVDRPSYAAGTAIGVIGRLIATYKGHMMYLLQSGFGEGVVSPLYEAMVRAGVRFEFFSKVRRLELSADKRTVARVAVGRQANVLGAGYQPTFREGGMNFWPDQPFWDQLENGAALKAKGVNFESHWCPEPMAGETILEAGKDFDVIVLAITMGAYKKLNADPTMCDELIAANADFRDFTNKMDIVPTQSLQLWIDRTPAEMGWKAPKAAAVSGPEYLNIFADMSQVLDVERDHGADRPKTLYYLTGTYKTTLYARPAAEAGVPAQASGEIFAQSVEWLVNESGAMWPLASHGKSFDWAALHAPATTKGEKRLENQYWRANIDPNECCVLSCAGMTEFRLGPDESGFANLILAGEATRHGFNTTAVEGAVMSGKAASRAICGAPVTIVGYDFLRRKPSQGSGA